jgi:putative peptidoglycan lipid II flippase
MGKSLGFASALYAASILLSRVIGLVREAVIGRTLGNGAEADVYWTAFILPDFLNYLLAGGALSLVFIPIFQAYWAREDEAGAWRAFSRIAAVLGAVVVLATVGLWCATPWLTPLIAPGMSAAQHEQLVALVRILLPAQIFHVVGGLLSATLQARDRHAMPALAPLVYTLGVIIGGVALGPWLGAAGFAWGVLAGSILGPLACRYGARGGRVCDGGLSSAGSTRTSRPIFGAHCRSCSA